ncbi:Autophagy protein 5 [Lithohypha guttulata]|uniref:Autophagy protein 5 n=1 Tax=Lithohypha guttulata TaxID=1690604 RepID=UPI002DE121A2|nr:Autophagy protein 5 [Lithohypha guttulata]
MATPGTAVLDDIQRHVWAAKILVEVQLSASESRQFDKSEPYMEELITDIASITPGTGHFSYDGVPLRWHLPIGLLYDLHILATQDVSHDDSGPSTGSKHKPEPFRLTVHFSQSYRSKHENQLIDPTPDVVHDAYVNSVKEADFLRTGTAKPIMSLSATDSKLLWSATQESDSAVFSRIYQSLLPSDAPWRSIPLRVYLPSTPNDAVPESEVASGSTKSPTSQGQIRVIQSQITPYVAATSTPGASQLRAAGAGQGTPQTLGSALHSLLPSLFPSRRTPILAKALLHGTVLPMNAVLEEVASKACYADGWVNVVVAITT